MGIVTVLDETTKDPITLMGKRAGICWGSDIEDPKKNYKRGLDCLKSGHGRVLEFVNIEMVLDGYSARVIREWYTHIGGAPTRLQASTRYIDCADFDSVMPKSIGRNEEARDLYMDTMREIQNVSGKLKDLGIPKEDIAMILPLGMTTKIVDKRNLRNLIEMSHQRMCTRAYWEYRDLFKDVSDALRGISGEWAYIADHYFVPKCEVLGYCPEKNGCGRKAKLN